MNNYPKKVYAIQHNVTKKIYIGSSNDVSTRYLGHMYALRSNKHSVEDMQDDFNKYGEDYSVFVLGDIETQKEKYKEYEFMLKYNTYIRDVGYNYKDSVLLRKIQRPIIPYKEGTPVIGGKDEYMKEQNKNKHKVIKEFIESLTEDQLNKIISRFDEIKELLEEYQ